MAVTDYNPFAKRSSFDSRSLLAYKVLTVISWLLVLITGAAYTFSAPHHGHTIWAINSAHHSPFALNKFVTSIYWVVLLITQAGYIWHLYSANKDWVNHAANVGSHFIFHNLLTFGFLMLYTRGHFWQAELLTIVDFINLSALYFRHPTTPRIVHIAAVSGPLAWNYMALFWNGAIMVGAHNLPARIVANVFIWSFLGYGGFFILAYKDYTMGFALSILMLSLALAQIATKAFALQWIFAFAIMGALAVLSVLFGIPSVAGKEGEAQRQRTEGAVVSQDAERQPLLRDE